jgi:hypothetical protein
MDHADLRARVQALLDGGQGDPLPGAGGERFLALVTLDSGARCGLDREARWLLVPDDAGAPLRFSPADAHLFHEPLEWKRARFDDAIEEAARALGLPAEDVLFSFPAVAVIRAVLAKQVAYLTRLALSWIGPTELRELRRDILAVAKSREMPAPVKELADRLVVPE